MGYVLSLLASPSFVKSNALTLPCRVSGVGSGTPWTGATCTTHHRAGLLRDPGSSDMGDGAPRVRGERKGNEHFKHCSRSRGWGKKELTATKLAALFHDL